MQTLMRLIADQMQRIERFVFRFRPAGIPLRMAAAIVIAETLDRLGEDFDFTGWCLQREGYGIITEGTRRPSVIRLERQTYLSTFPERFEIGSLMPTGGKRPTRCFIEEGKPFRLLRPSVKVSNLPSRRAISEKIS